MTIILKGAVLKALYQSTNIAFNAMIHESNLANFESLKTIF